VPQPPACAEDWPAYPEVTQVICRVPSAHFAQAPWYALPVHLCRFRVRSTWRLFPETSQPLGESVNPKRHLTSVTIHWPTNIDVVPIDYGFRPRLRGRLTLRRLTLRRNPWTFGGRDSHSPLVTRVCIRTSDTSRSPHGSPFTGLRNAPLPLIAELATSVHSFSPVTFSAQKPLFRPVSCYAFFK
jgi:hypothetical protein